MENPPRFFFSNEQKNRLLPCHFPLSFRTTRNTESQVTNPQKKPKGVSCRRFRGFGVETSADEDIPIVLWFRGPPSISKQQGVERQEQTKTRNIYNCLYIYICTCIFIENGGNPQRETPNPYVGILRLVTVRIAKQDIRLFKSPSIRGTGGVWTQGHLQYIRVLSWMSWPLIGSMARNMGSFTHVSHRVYESYPP